MHTMAHQASTVILRFQTVRIEQPTSNFTIFAPQITKMTLSYQWLCEYLPVKPSPDEISTILTSVGLEVDSMEKSEAVKGGLEGLLIGKVVECAQHPNADKLKVTKVNVGSTELLNIVCGAPNVAAGQTVVVATVGTTVHPLKGEPFLIKKAKIRGEESEGMICAEDEIGLGESHDGIIVLNEDIAPGTLAKDYYKIAPSDIIFEIGLTPNRMDAMSHLGAVKDICAYLSNRDQKPYVSKIPNIQIPNSKEEILNELEIGINTLKSKLDNSNIDIRIEDTARCARYAGICIDEIKVADSPEWLQTRLKSIGLRPINNIVDITNFVLHECGQPLHAFDRKAIKGNTVIIKTLADKTKFITLDEKERELSNEDLMICNAEEPMCIAGVFGGLHSGVTTETTSIFLESAWFENNSIRKTSMRHGLRTDAAVRFEKGADISNVPYALQRAASMICDIAGGKIVSDLMDIYPVAFEAKTIDVSFKKVQSLAGKEYSASQIKNILTSLCFSILEENEQTIKISVPFAKPDITMQADVVEEIMRIDGLDNIPFTGKISFALPSNTEGFKPEVKNQLAQVLVGKGFQEIFTNSITNSAFYPDQTDIVKMMNSLSAELDCMRPSMLETGLVAIAYNLNRKNTQLKFFEFGKTYKTSNEGFIEDEKLCLYFSGNYGAEHWNQKEQKIDAYYVKGIIESLLYAMKPELVEEDGMINILFQRKKIGHIEVVSAAKQKQFDIKQEVWFAELAWDVIRSFYEKQKVGFKGIPKFPTVKRDLALILDKQVHYQEVQKTVKQAKSRLLQSVNLFDVFESEKLGAGKKSYAINLSFYDDEKTLTDVEVETEIKLIIESLEKKLGASIRS